MLVTHSWQAGRHHTDVMALSQDGVFASFQNASTCRVVLLEYAAQSSSASGHQPTTRLVIEFSASRGTTYRKGYGLLPTPRSQSRADVGTGRCRALITDDGAAPRGIATEAAATTEARSNSCSTLHLAARRYGRTLARSKISAAPLRCGAGYPPRKAAPLALTRPPWDLALQIAPMARKICLNLRCHLPAAALAPPTLLPCRWHDAVPVSQPCHRSCHGTAVSMPCRCRAAATLLSRHRQVMCRHHAQPPCNAAIYRCHVPLTCVAAMSRSHADAMLLPC